MAQSKFKEIEVFWAGNGTGFCLGHMFILVELLVLRGLGLLDTRIPLVIIPPMLVGFATLWFVSRRQTK